ncbi:MAG: aminotransferase class IV [Candidatus Planktophila sp.]
MKIWVNDQLVDASAEFVDEAGWPHGSGIFETLRTENGRVQLLSRHMRRAIASGGELGIPIPNEDVILAAVDAILRTEVHQIGRLRLTFSNGQFIATHLPYTAKIDGYKVCVIRVVNLPVGKQQKTYPYTSRLAILDEVSRNGFDEVILVGADGRVTEGATSNYLFRCDGEWITPPMGAGILPGVIRALAIEECGVVVRDINEEDLVRCEAAVIVSSLKIAQAVSSIDARVLANDLSVADICSKLSDIAASH